MILTGKNTQRKSCSSDNFPPQASKLKPILRGGKQHINSLRHGTAWLQHHVNIL